MKKFVETLKQTGRAIRAMNLPNKLTLLRVALVPLYLVLLWFFDNDKSMQIWPLLVFTLASLTDMLDGRIARRYNMVTDLGKVLDPVADKLTQCAMMLCVAMRYPAMWWLLGLHVVKEIIMLVMGWYVLKKTDTVNSAIWVGKLCTGVIYAVMMLHVIMPYLPQAVSIGCTVVCAGLIVLSLIVYTARYVKILGGTK